MDVLDHLTPEERWLFRLRRLGYEQHAIGTFLGGCRQTAAKRIHELRSKVNQLLNEDRDMKRADISDRDLYRFADAEDGAPCFGNDNLRRAIRRILDVSRRTLHPVLDEEDPPIPPGDRSAIVQLIEQHEQPPTIQQLLDEASEKPSALEGLCWDLLEWARRENKPFRWLGEVESLRQISDPVHAKQSIGSLTRFLGDSLRLFSQCRKNIGSKDNLSCLVAEKLEDLATRFEHERGAGATPIRPLSERRHPLDSLTESMHQQELGLFKTLMKEFFEACEDVKARGGRRRNPARSSVARRLSDSPASVGGV